MTNSLNDVYTEFFDRVEQDKDFFMYFHLDEISAMEVAKERARSYLRNACSYLRRHVTLEFNLGFVKDETGLETFITEITDDEVTLLAEIMVGYHYERALAKLLPKFNTFSASELKLLHSPANERQTYTAMVAQVWANIDRLIADYYAKDRLTGAEKMISMAIPEETEDDA